eukprot:scaffold215346_cov27-Attheya_sp.AAC.1
MAFMLVIIVWTFASNFFAFDGREFLIDVALDVIGDCVCDGGWGCLSWRGSRYRGKGFGIKE